MGGGGGASRMGGGASLGSARMSGGFSGGSAMRGGSAPSLRSASPGLSARSSPNLGGGSNFSRSNPSLSSRPNVGLGSRPSLNLSSPNLGSSLSRSQNALPRATNINPRQPSGANPLANNPGLLRGSTALSNSAQLNSALANPRRSNLPSSNLTSRALNGANPLAGSKALNPQGLSSNFPQRGGPQAQTALRPSLNNPLAGANRNGLNNSLRSGDRPSLNTGLDNPLAGTNRNPLNSGRDNPLAGLNRNALNNGGLNNRELNNGGLNGNRPNNPLNANRPPNALGQGLAGANRNNLQNININNNNINLNNLNRGPNGNWNGGRGPNNNLGSRNAGPNAHWRDGNWNSGNGGQWRNGQWSNGNWNGNWNGHHHHGHYHNHSWYHGHRYNPWGYYGGFGGWGLWGVGFGWGGSGWGFGYGYPYGYYGGYGLTNILYRSGYCSYYNPYYVANTAVVYDYSQPIPVTVAAADPVPVPVAVDNLDLARQSFKIADYPAALNAVNRAIQAQPDDAVLHELRALTLFATGDYDQAAATLYSVLAVGPGWDWATMVGLYPNVETYTNQLRALENFARNNPRSASSRFVLAYHYMTQGFPQEAATTLKEVLTLQPNDQGAANLLKMLEPQQGGNLDQNPALAGLGNPAPAAANPNVVAKPPVAAPPLDILPAGVPNNLPAANAPPIDGPALVGSWQAARENDKFQLTLGADQSFTWKYAQGVRVETLSGTYNVEGSLLVMQVKDGGQMIGRITVVRDPGGKTAGFEFKMLGANPDDPGLRFSK